MIERDSINKWQVFVTYLSELNFGLSRHFRSSEGKSTCLCDCVRPETEPVVGCQATSCVFVLQPM